MRRQYAGRGPTDLPPAAFRATSDFKARTPRVLRKRRAYQGHIQLALQHARSTAQSIRHQRRHRQPPTMHQRFRTSQSSCLHRLRFQLSLGARRQAPQTVHWASASDARDVPRHGFRTHHYTRHRPHSCLFLIRCRAARIAMRLAVPHRRAYLCRLAVYVIDWTVGARLMRNEYGARGSR